MRSSKNEREQEEEKINFKDITEKQMKEGILSKTGVKMFNLPGRFGEDNSGEKRSVLQCLGLRREQFQLGIKDKIGKYVVVQVVKEVENKGRKLQEETEEVTRISIYAEGEQRPIIL